MRYERTVEGRFVDRPNRFIAHVIIENVLETVHVKNTGRLSELLLPDAPVILQISDNPNRKTKYDLIAVYRDTLGWVNIDSQVTNKVMHEWLRKSGFEHVKPEYTYGASRLDFYAEKDGERFLIEVKGCTLEIGGFGWFPDAKSDRASKHMMELTRGRAEGYRCVAAFVIAMEGVFEVKPHAVKDPAFARAFEEAQQHGVEIWHMACEVGRNSMEISDKMTQNELE